MVLDFVAREDSKITFSKNRVILPPWIGSVAVTWRHKPSTVRRAERFLFRFGRCKTDVPRTSCPPAGRKTCLQVAFLMGLPVESAFALLLTRVTELIMCLAAQKITDITPAVKYYSFYLSKFPSATLSSIVVTLATTHSSALQMKIYPA